MAVNIPETSRKRVVIIGAGFGGLALAKKLVEQDLQVVLLDRNNYHTFQPLLYQVATGGLEPDSIAYPLRKLFRGKQHFHFRMAEVEQIFQDKKRIATNVGEVWYDYLIVATGSMTNFFTFEGTKERMMPLKTIPQALDLRSHIIQNLESALMERDPASQDSFLNIVIVGGGPTGIELAGALGEMKKYILPKEYPELDMEMVDIYLFERGAKLLDVMSAPASEKSLQYLRELGVEVRLGTAVSEYDGTNVVCSDGTVIHAHTLIWTAGVKGALVNGLPDECLAGTRFKVDGFSQIIGMKDVFALGDVAAMIDEDNPRGHPMVAPVAIQQAELLAKNLPILISGKGTPQKFKYNNQGSMATIGRNRAVVDLPHWKFQGVFAWFVWMFVHLISLVGFRNKVVVLFGWMHNYFTYDRAMRLIIRPFARKL